LASFLSKVLPISGSRMIKRKMPHRIKVNLLRDSF